MAIERIEVSPQASYQEEDIPIVPRKRPDIINFLLTEVSYFGSLTLNKKYPTLNILRHPRYFSFRKETFSLIDQYGKVPRIFGEKMGELLDDPKYSYIKNRHFAYHDRLKGSTQT